MAVMRRAMGLLEPLGDRVVVLQKQLTMAGVADLLRVSAKTVSSYVAVGLIPSARIGRRILFDPEEIEAWLKKRNPCNNSVPWPR